MKPWWKVLGFLSLSFVSAFNAAAADEVYLVNGDRLSGKLIRMEAGKLVFSTEYSDEITIDWEKVADLITTDPIKVILGDGTVFEGLTSKSPVGLMRLKTKKIQAPSEFSLAEITAINPAEKPVVRVTARLNTGITSQDGNTKNDQIHVDAAFVARTEKSRSTVSGELNKEKDDNTTTVENWLAYGSYNYFLTKKWFMYVNTLLEHDKFSDLDLRSTLGAGPGYQIFESETLNLYVQAGPAYVNENFIEAEDDDYTAAQWLINYDQYLFEKFVQLFHIQTGFIDVNNTSNWLFKSRQGLRFPIYKGFTTSLEYDYDYDNDPSENAEKKWDSKLMFLLGWQFEN